MPDGMELLSRSLRAGHALPAAIELVGEEIPEPMGSEMMIVYEEQQFGISLSEALMHLWSGWRAWICAISSPRF